MSGPEETDAMGEAVKPVVPKVSEQKIDNPNQPTRRQVPGGQAGEKLIKICQKEDM